MTTLSSNTIAALTAIRDAQIQLPASEQRWAQAYQVVRDDLTSQGANVDASVIYWFDRAISINSNNQTPENTFIRTYTVTSAALQGVILSAEQLQAA
jgi:hypothetical protein